MHELAESPGHPEFVKTVNEIRKAEEEQERLILSASEEAKKIVHEARESAQRERLKMEEELVAFKNSQLRKGSEEVEAEVQKILKKAKDDCAGLGKKGVSAQAIGKIVKDLLGPG
jgi:vacuolar-type H+-ATPase subunit H